MSSLPSAHHITSLMRATLPGALYQGITIRSTVWHIWPINARLKCPGLAWWYNMAIIHGSDVRTFWTPSLEKALQASCISYACPRTRAACRLVIERTIWRGSHHQPRECGGAMTGSPEMSLPQSLRIILTLPFSSGSTHYLLPPVPA